MTANIIAANAIFSLGPVCGSWATTDSTFFWTGQSTLTLTVFPNVFVMTQS